MLVIRSVILQEMIAHTMDISVTFHTGPSGTMALVRFKEPGMRPEFRQMPMPGPLEEELDALLAFIWNQTDGQPHQRQGWLWET